MHLTICIPLAVSTSGFRIYGDAKKHQYTLNAGMSEKRQQRYIESRGARQRLQVTGLAKK